MAQFTLQLQDLKNILDFLNSFNLVKNENPNIRKVRFELSNNQLLIALVNQNLNLEFRTEIEYLEDKLVFFVEADMLVKLFNSVKSDIEFTVELDTHGLKLKYGRSKSSIRFHTDTLDWFNQISISDYSEVLVNGESFKQCFKEACIFKASVTTKPVFLNVLFNFMEECGEIASSDTFTFYKNKIEYLVPATLKEFTKVLITPKSISSIAHILKEEVRIKFNENNLVFESGKFKLSCNIADGEFPNYNKILPQSFDFKLKLNVKDLSETIRQVLTFKEDLINNRTSWDINLKDNNLTISAKDSKLQEVNSELTLEVKEIIEDIETIDFRINGSSILDYLAIAKEEFLILSGSIGKPVILTGETNQDKIVYIAILNS